MTGLIHDHGKDSVAPSGLLQQCRKPAVAQAHLWGRKDHLVGLFLQVLWGPSANESAYNEHSEHTFRTELSRAPYVSLFTATAGIQSFVVKNRA